MSNAGLDLPYLGAGRGGGLGRLHQDRVTVADDRMTHHLGERRHRSDLEATVHLADAAQPRHAAQIDDVARTLDAILQPVEAVEPAREHPGVGPISPDESECVVHRRRLEQLERRHHVTDHRHAASPAAKRPLTHASISRRRVTAIWPRARVRVAPVEPALDMGLERLVHPLSIFE